MTSAMALLKRINRNASAGRGLRLTLEETDILRAVLELSEACGQAHALDRDAGQLAEQDQGSTLDAEPAQ